MKILIAGSDNNARLLASYLKIENSDNDIYITTDEISSNETYTPINIKENDISAISDFVKYNQIEFTIALSSIAIINGIADEFKKEGFIIFAPSSEAARVTFFNSIAKKIMYKLKINTPKFGIFDRENLAVEYVRNSKFPISVKNDFTLLSRIHKTFNSFLKAKSGIQEIFEEGNNKIVIENYIEEPPIYLYFITDGYNALPLISTERTEQENFIITKAPSQKISEKIIMDVLQRVIYPLLDDITKYTDMYVGIIGVKIKIKNNSFYVLEFYNSFQEYDFQAFIPILDDNLLNILYETAENGLSENRSYIKLSDHFSYTISINKSKFNNINGDDEDFIISEDGKNYIYTNKASTLNHAQKNLNEYLKTIIDKKTMDLILKASELEELKL